MRLRLIVLLLSSCLLGCPAEEKPAATTPAATPAVDVPDAPDAPDAPAGE